ncbi:uncharacterized protein LOC130123275 [Lampris incognitus]|uniref:uncharacterized protein LOC130123275 n=1 Tax=Lampris incognitus TaxID=2546036 RepID=UPI0024B589C0|nr:uncharacterized protein LOC130123275 [Lampris incognitus]
MNLFRPFVIERLTAGAEEILGAFERTIEEREEEIDRQRRLLDIILKPSVTLHRTDFVQLSDQQHCKQERNPILAKEEQREFWFSPQEDQLPLQEKQDLTTAAAEGDHLESRYHQGGNGVRSTDQSQRRPHIHV